MGCLFLALSPIAVNAQDSLEVRIKLKDVNSVLTFNQSFVPDNSLEYSWTVLIDIDGDSLTGNTVGYGGNSGFDVAMAVSHFKFSGSTSQTGSIVSNNTQKNTIALNGTQATVVHTMYAFIDYADSSLVMRASLNTSEFNGLPQRFMVYTSYYSSTGNVEDFSPLIVEQGTPYTFTDALNDVAFPFIDIKEVYMGGYPLGFGEAGTDGVKLIVSPNPTDGIFTIKADFFKETFVSVYNSVGQRILQQQNTVVDLNGFPEGIYFVKIYDKERSYTKKIILKN